MSSFRLSKGESTAEYITELNNNNEGDPRKEMIVKELQNDGQFNKVLDGNFDKGYEDECVHMEEGDGLMNDERELYENVISEFDGLRQAVNTYITVID